MRSIALVAILTSISKRSTTEYYTLFYTLSIESYILMTQSDNDTLEIQRPTVPVGAFKQAASGIEFALTELITEIALADTYTGDDAIVHAVEILNTTHTLQAYLFHHVDLLVEVKKLKTYEQNPNQI
jgi:hypothetical protein